MKSCLMAIWLLVLTSVVYAHESMAQTLSKETPMVIQDRLVGTWKLVSAWASDQTDAYATSFAYAGRFSVAHDEVIHHVEISTVENWVNTDLVRLVRFEGERIGPTTPPLSVGGTPRITALVRERLK